jgi:outer membrane immunogenic protein
MRTLYVKRIAAIGGAFLGLAALVVPAFAADIIRPPPVVVAPKVAVFSWTGCYIGVQGGYGWGDKHFVGQSEFDDLNTNVHVKGWLAGGQVGCDKQFASGHVFGVEGMGLWTNIRGTEGFTIGPVQERIEGTVSARINWLASITARVGHANGQHLWYVKGGAAFARETDTLTGEPGCLEVAVAQLDGCDGNTPLAAVGPTVFSGRAIHAGWTVGVGGEWAVHSGWSVALEYNFYHFGTERVAFYSPRIGGLGVPVDVTPRIHTLTIALNHRF